MCSVLHLQIFQAQEVLLNSAEGRKNKTGRFFRENPPVTAVTAYRSLSRQILSLQCDFAKNYGLNIKIAQFAWNTNC